MIVNYDDKRDQFVMSNKLGPVLYLDPKSMKELIETAQLAVAERLAITGKMTV